MSEKREPRESAFFKKSRVYYLMLRDLELIALIKNPPKLPFVIALMHPKRSLRVTIEEIPPPTETHPPGDEYVWETEEP